MLYTEVPRNSTMKTLYLFKEPLSKLGYYFNCYYLSGKTLQLNESILYYISIIYGSQSTNLFYYIAHP